MAHLRLAEETEELSSLNEIHHHVQVPRILPCPPQRDQERVPNSVEHASFIVGMLNLLHLDHLGLLQDLDRIEPMVMLRLHQVDTPEATGAERALEGEVVKGIFSLGCARVRPDGLLGISIAPGAGAGMRDTLLGRMDYILDAGGIGLVRRLRVAGSGVGGRGMRRGGLHGGRMTFGLI